MFSIKAQDEVGYFVLENLCQVLVETNGFTAYWEDDSAFYQAKIVEILANIIE